MREDTSSNFTSCSKAILNKKVFPTVREKLVSALGDLEIDELFNFVVEHVQQRASPQAIVEGLEPVGGAIGFCYR